MLSSNIVEKYKKLEEAIYIKNSIDTYTKNNQFKIITNGVLEYIPLESSKDKIAVCFCGRNCDPQIKTEGIHSIAAYFSMMGFNSFISSAHDSSRRVAKALVIQEIEKYETIPTIYVFGHSHGADHASVFCKEIKGDIGVKVNYLYTMDPVNSPWPFPLTKIADTNSVCCHRNYYQRNFLFFGGSIKTANENTNVSNYKTFPSLSKLIKNKYDKKPTINHCTIDLDMLLNKEIIKDIYA